MNNSQCPIARKSGLVVQEVPDEVLVYDLESNKAHCLNQSAAMIWKSCDGNTSVSEIAKLVENQAGGKVTEDFVWLAIDTEKPENAAFKRKFPVEALPTFLVLDPKTETAALRARGSRGRNSPSSWHTPSSTPSPPSWRPTCPTCPRSRTG